MIFKGLKKKSAEKFINKQLEQIHEKSTASNSKIKTVGCIVDIEIFSDVEAIKGLAGLLKVQPNHISVIQYKERTEKGEEFSGLLFTDNDFGWKGSVVGKDLNQFVSKKYDLLINYFDNEKLGPKLAAMHCNAAFKAGFDVVDHRMNDLIIHSDLKDFKSFSSELTKYLSILNKLSND